jgi:HEAT repeat protein
MRWISAALIVAGTLTIAASAQTSQPKTKDLPKRPPIDASKVAGKTFEQWVLELKTKDPSKRETAIHAICAFPYETSVKAIPALLVEMKKHGPSTPVDLSVRCNLCQALAVLFASGEKIDAKVQAEAVALLRGNLRDSQAILKFRALSALAAIGPGAHAAIPEITLLLKDTSTWEVRQAAANALGYIAHDGKRGPPVPVLVSLYALLNDNAHQVRVAAVQSLSWLGPPPDADSVNVYVNSLLPVARNDPEPGLQIWARVAIIGATNDYSNNNIDPIAKHARSVDPIIRAQALQAIGTLGPKAKSKIPALIECLSDADATVQSSAIWALGRMETASLNALPTLDKMAADADRPDYIKRSAKEAAEKIRGK